MLEEALRFIESDEMRNYLERDCLRGANPWWSNYTCLIIANSPAPLEDKINALENLVRAGYNKKYCSERHKDPGKVADAGRFALEETQNSPSGAIFILTECFRNSNSFPRYSNLVDEEITPFTSFDAARNFSIANRNAYDTPNDIDDRRWFYVDKWIPADESSMINTLRWTLSPTSDIWFFDVLATSDEVKRRMGDYNSIFSIYTDGPSLPVPFEPGDIITIDCRPFLDVFHAVIADLGDNRDCCAVQIFYMGVGGKINTHALKHDMATSNLVFDMYTHFFSALYRASIFIGELPKRETPLAILSKAIKKEPSFLDRYWEAFGDRTSGVRWKELKKIS
jgi:hypothetical protein